MVISLNSRTSSASLDEICSSFPVVFLSQRLTLSQHLLREKDENGFVDEFETAQDPKHSALDAIPVREDMRTFVFSATMSKDLQQNVKRRNRRYRMGQPEDSMSSLGSLPLSSQPYEKASEN
jgi:ATP-dependent RNA helicase DDX24/MAK5